MFRTFKNQHLIHGMEKGYREIIGTERERERERKRRKEQHKSRNQNEDINFKL